MTEKYRSVERFAREIMETGTLGVGRTVGNRGVAFRGHSHSSSDSGIKVGAKRNQAHERAAAEKAEQNHENRKAEVERRENEAEKRRKESENRSKQMKMNVSEGRYTGMNTDSLKGIHQRAHGDIMHPSNKNVKYSSSDSFAGTVDKEYEARKELAKRGIKVEKPKHQAVIEADENTEKRRQIKNVARLDDPDPKSDKSTLARTASIKTKIVDEGRTNMFKSDRALGLPESLVDMARAIMEKRSTDGLQGGKTEVDLKPTTDDDISDQLDDGPDDDKKSKKSDKKCDDCGKPMSKCTCDDHDHDDDKKSKKSVKEEAQGTTPKTAKEKKLAALSSPKDKITHKDVLVGRGVIAKEEEELDERSLSDTETKKKEEYVMGMKKRLAGFEKRYPGRGENVMYATATKMAKEELSQEELDAVAEIAASISMDEEIDEAKRRNVPDRQTVTSSPIRGANQDQSGHGVTRNVADYTISDEFVEEENVDEMDMFPSRSTKSASLRDRMLMKQLGRLKDPTKPVTFRHGSMAPTKDQLKDVKKEEFEIDEDQLDEARGRPRLPRDAQGKVIRDPAAIAAHRAATDTKKAESPHIVDQLRGVVSSGGKQKVTFKSGETKDVSVKHAKAGLLIHHAAGKPADKAKMASRMWHSHGSFVSALRGDKAPEPKVKRAETRGSQSLPTPKSLEKPISAMSAKTIKRTAKAFAAYRAKKNK